MPTNPADIRNAVLLSVATVAAGFVVPVIPYLGLPLAAFALSWLAYRFGVMPAALLSVATAACVAILGPAVLGTAVLDGAFVAVALLGVGPVAALALRKYPAVNVAAALGLVITLAFLTAPVGAQTLKAVTEVSAQAWAALAKSGSVSDPVALKTLMVTQLAQIPLNWPWTSFYTMGLGVAFGVPLVGRAARSLGQEVRRFGPLADLDVSFHVVWPTIIGFACAAAGTLWHQSPAILGTIGTNILMFVRPFLFLQGAAVFAALYRRAGAGRFARTAGMVLMLLTEVFVPLISLLGIVDLFANLRKVQRGHGAHPGPEA